MVKPAASSAAKSACGWRGRSDALPVRRHAIAREALSPMLRALVLLFLIVNAALYYWLQSDPNALQADREPQRLGRQVSPDAIQVLPDLPASGTRAGSVPASTASAATSSASGADQAIVAGTTASAASGSSTAFAHKTSDAEIDCAETPPIDNAQFAALKAALTKAGVPADAIADRRQQQGGSWIVYLGRYADAQAWQQKADEMHKLDVKFERVNTPSTLAPGLSLGQFSNQPDATKKLDELSKHGVRGAKVVTMTAPIILRHLQVRATDPAWHHATGSQRFNSCPVDAPSNA